jgi:hypothetical protein
MEVPRTQMSCPQTVVLRQPPWAPAAWSWMRPERVSQMSHNQPCQRVLRRSAAWDSYSAMPASLPPTSNQLQVDACERAGCSRGVGRDRQRVCQPPRPSSSPRLLVPDDSQQLALLWTAVRYDAIDRTARQRSDLAGHAAPLRAPDRLVSDALRRRPPDAPSRQAGGAATLDRPPSPRSRSTREGILAIASCQRDRCWRSPR